jgi:hypothetical protein
MYPILFQLRPAAGILTVGYTVPVSRFGIINSIIITNQGANTTFSITLVKPDADDAVIQYIFKDSAIKRSETIAVDLDMILQTKSVIKVQSASGQVSFNIMGDEKLKT